MCAVASSSTGLGFAREDYTNDSNTHRRIGIESFRRHHPRLFHLSANRLGRADMTIRFDLRTIRYWRGALKPRAVSGRFINDQWVDAS